MYVRTLKDIGKNMDNVAMVTDHNGRYVNYGVLLAQKFTKIDLSN